MCRGGVPVLNSGALTNHGSSSTTSVAVYTHVADVLQLYAHPHPRRCQKPVTAVDRRSAGARGTRDRQRLVVAITPMPTHAAFRPAVAQPKQLFADGFLVDVTAQNARTDAVCDGRPPERSEPGVTRGTSTKSEEAKDIPAVPPVCVRDATLAGATVVQGAVGCLPRPTAAASR